MSLSTCALTGFCSTGADTVCSGELGLSTAEPVTNTLPLLSTVMWPAASSYIRFQRLVHKGVPELEYFKIAKSWNVPLPIDLTPLGMTGCKLYGDQILAIPVATDAAGSIKLQVGVPSGSGWGGVHFVGQAIIADPGANPANLVASDAVEGIIR